MYKGEIYCGCGLAFSFETIFDTVKCPNCHKEIDATKYPVLEEIVEEPVEELPQEEEEVTEQEG